MKQINDVPVVDKRKLPRRIVNEDNREFYTAHLNLLTPKQKIIMTKWLEINNQAVVARQLNVNPGTVSRQITLACSKLDQYLDNKKAMPIIYKGKPYKYLEIKCSKKFIKQHLKYLPPKLGEMTKQYFIDHKTHFQIADEFNVKPETALQNMYDARSILEGFLNGAPLPLLKNGKRFTLKRKKYWDNDFIMDHLQYLSPLQAKIAPLFYIENLSYEEIAKRLDNTVGNVRTNATLTRIKLNEMQNGTFNYERRSKKPDPDHYLRKIGYDKDFVESHMDLLTENQAKLAKGLLLDGKTRTKVSKELSIKPSNASIYLKRDIKKKFDRAYQQEHEQ